MSKYPIKKEYFPFSHFTPPISEEFLTIAVPHMKVPKFIYNDKELDVSRHEVESFEGLPHAYIETAEFDCLHDDGIIYAEKLREAGVDVVLNETKGTMHGFDIVQKAETTKAAVSARTRFMRTAFYGEFTKAVTK